MIEMKRFNSSLVFGESMEMIVFWSSWGQVLLLSKEEVFVGGTCIKADWRALQFSVVKLCK